MTKKYFLTNTIISHIQITRYQSTFNAIHSITHSFIHTYIKHVLCASDKNSLWRILTLKEKIIKQYDQCINKGIEECTGQRGGQESINCFLDWQRQPHPLPSIFLNKNSEKKIWLIFTAFFLLGNTDEWNFKPYY